MRLLSLILALLLAGSGLTALRADEPTRQVQEELRKRSLFYGDVDGRQSAALSAALRQYQERKGFPATGEINGDTLRSMGIAEVAGGDQPLPNVPVLRSDRGVGSNREAGGALPLAPNPALLSAPPPSREELRSFIRAYLDACQSAPVSDELRFYGGRVDYFDHGLVTKTYIRNELVAYNQQWPDRRYQTTNEVSISKRGFQTVARCRIKFDLGNSGQNRRATGETDNSFTLSRRPDLSWEIVGHREERVLPVAQRSARRTGKSHRRQGDPLGRTLRKVERSVKKFFR